MLASFAPCFTKPSFETFRHYISALMLGEGRRAAGADPPWRAMEEAAENREDAAAQHRATRLR